MAGTASNKSVPCPRCKKDVPAEGLQAGTLARCPKCSMEFLVTGGSLGLVGDDAEEYGLKTPLPSPPSRIPPALPVKPADFASVADQPPVRSDAEEVALYQQVMRDEELEIRANEQEEESEGDEEEEEPKHWRPKTPPPAGLYRSAIFPHLFAPASLVRMTVLSLSLFLVLGMIWEATDFMAVPGGGFAAFGAWFGGMFFALIGIISGIGCFLYAAASGMSIVCDTADGRKKIESWPRGFLFDWFQEAGYVLGGIFFSVLPGIPISWMLRGSGIPQPAILAVVAAFLFPLALLAELDAGIGFFPASLGVWSSPFLARRAWLDFYLITVPMIAIVSGLSTYAFQEGNFLLLFFSCMLGGFGWFLYFRLLGRLAWYASGKAEASEE